MFLPTLLQAPGLSYPELKSFIIGEKVHEGNALFYELIDSTAPLTSWIYGLTDFLFGRNLVARHILAFLVIFSQATYMGILCLNRKVFSDNTYLPSLFFVALFAFSFDTLALTGELLGLGFLLLAINMLFKELEFRAQRDDTVLGVGLFISLASLCHFAYSVFLIAGIFALIFYSRRDIRILMLLVIGFALPHLILICTYLVIGRIEYLIDFFYGPNLSLKSIHYITIRALLLVGAIPLGFFLFSLLIVTRETRLNKYQSQILQSMFIWVIFAFLCGIYSKDLRPQSFIAVIPSFSFFFTHFFLSFQRKLFAELSIWFLLVGLFLTSYSARYGYLTGVSYDALFTQQEPGAPVNKRILVLSDDLSYYAVNRLATPYFNWQLSKPVFEQADYYENTVEIYTAIKKDPPEIIIDPDHYLKVFFERSPELKAKYVRNEHGQYSMR
jgi:hypothetical protein